MQKLTSKEIITAQAAGEPIFCLDIRESYRRGTLQLGANQVSYQEIQSFTKLRQYTEYKVVLCCIASPSSRVAKARKSLMAIGYPSQNICELQDGMLKGWFETEGRACKMPRVSFL